jgi:hypothetical protein
MSTWSDMAAYANAAIFDAFGEEVIYQMAPDAPLSILAIRKVRAPEELLPAGSFEGIEVRESDFVAGPEIGARVSFQGSDYVVSDVRNADPAGGTRVLVLNKR